MKVLAVDDDEFIAELVPLLLSNCGDHEVSISMSAEEALTTIANEDDRFDCLFLDIQMPGMSGIELCGKIRALPGYRTTPIFMLTAMNDKSYIDQAFAAGATDYVTKPFDVMAIGEKILAAENLIAEQKENWTRQFSEPTSQTDGSTDGKMEFSDANSLEMIEGAVEYDVLSNYLNQLSKSRLYNSKIFAVKVDQAEIIHTQGSSSEFLRLVKEVGCAISETLMSRGFFLMSYVGKGVFVCIFQNSGRESHELLEQHTQQLIQSKQLSYDNGTPAVVSVSMGDPLKPHLSFSKSPDRIFQLAITRVAGKPMQTMPYENKHRWVS